MLKKTKTIQANILLFDGFSNLCLANTIEPLRAANNVLDSPYYHWKISSLSGGEVKSSSGLTISPDEKLEPADKAQRLFLISSYGYDHIYSKSLGEVLRRNLYQGGEIYGLDTGAWIMAEAGLLNDKSATIHWDVRSRFEETFLWVNVESRPFVKEGALISCGGAMSAFDLMLDMIQMDLGAQLRFDVENLFRPTSYAPFKQEEIVSNLALTRKAIALMRENLEAPLKIIDIAADLNCHPKLLERAFKKELGLPAGQVYKRLRLGSVRDLVENSQASFSDISIRCGYKSASAMTRAFKSEFGYTPGALRRKSKL